MENNPQKNYLFYDLETNGLDYYTTGIMQISMIDMDGNVLLNQYVYPFDMRIECSDIHGIDNKKLIDNNAITTIELCKIIKRTIRERYGRENVYLTAYNNFGYDQIILENNFKICGLKVPSNWYFTDLYPIIKEIYPNMKPNFKLSTVFSQLCGDNEIIQFHCALADTTCLYNIFNIISKQPCNFDKYTRSSLHSGMTLNDPISTLNGYHSVIRFEQKGLKKVGDMYKIFEKVDFNEEQFKDYLKTVYNVYSNYSVTNILKYFGVIKHFLG
jgi:DNA polymerase III alpha subunit (gram-positive type)